MRRTTIRESTPWTTWQRIWALGLALAWAGQTVLMQFRTTWFDEGNYGYKGWLFLTGAARPFRDVWTEYPLGAYFVCGLPHALFSPDIAFHAARLVSALCVGGAGLLAYAAARRLGGRASGLLAVSFLVLNPWNNFWAAAPYAPGNLLLALTALGLVVERERPVRGRLLAVCALVGCVFLRANYAAAAVLAGLYLLVRGRGVREHLAVLGPGAVGALAFLASAGWSLENATAMLGVKIGSEAALLGGGVRFETLRPGPSESMLVRTYAIKAGAMVFTLLAVAAVAIADRDGRRRLGMVLRGRRPVLFLLVAYLVLVVFHATATWMPVRKYWPGYACYFGPWLAVALAVLVSGAWPGEWPRGARRLLAGCLAAMFVASLLAGPRNRVSFRDSDPSVVRAVGVALGDVSAPGDSVWSLGEPYFLLAARRTGPNPLVNGEHSYKDVAEDLASKRHRWNRAMALRWLDEADVALWSVRARGVLMKYGIFEGLAEAIETRLESDFRLAKEIDPGVPAQFRKWTTGPDGRGVSRGWVRIYVRKAADG